MKGLDNIGIGIGVVVGSDDLLAAKTETDQSSDLAQGDPPVRSASLVADRQDPTA